MQAQTGEQLRQTGLCKWFNATKGFGFITPEGGGEDLFVHQTNINSDGFRSLREGEAVEFEVEAGPDGRAKAVNVTGPQGHAPEGAPRTYGRGRGGAGRGRGAAHGTAGGGGMMPPQAFNGYGAYPQMQMPPMAPYGYYFFPAPGAGAGPSGRGGRGAGRGAMMGYPTMPATTQQVPTESSGLQVVVHNLPWLCTWQQLKDHFKEWRVERADVVYDAWGRSRGFGTVRFFTKQDADGACEKLNNTDIDGRTISVRVDRFA